ncbi:beta-glucosidase [Catenibacillus scindens]|uniref:beta-glucosidase n=1 Tax=Catenibacillus scindens TaxID=673271 RepID=A0A7W8HB27_9FIRM|nr:glycoside hydrolase family 3 N-terminal domain-containing protein [Catenibacillus scindens]MBB5264738.1 beta-glucosidase [Catenibacillus scindens]
MTIKYKEKDGYRLYLNEKGPVLGLSQDTKVNIIEKDGCLFKDFEGTGQLLPYEDWRLDARTRAADLASRLSVEEIAGLMLYSVHQLVPATNDFFFCGTYGGKEYAESGANPWDLTDQQKEFLTKDKIRHVLAMKLADAKTAARWNNQMQALAENTGHGIPVSISSDPRHGAGAVTAEYKAGNGDTSKWPEGIAMSATFDPKICYEFGKIASREYRAMGITTALSPQIDLATDPRWNRFGDTFGEHERLTIDMTKAYCDGMQTSIADVHSGQEKDFCEEGQGCYGADRGWGPYSVSAMAKHWPGGATGEGGRDAHFSYGKYAVYPGHNFAQHLKPFTEGAFKLDGPTGQAASLMPYYTISWDANQDCTEHVGNSYNHYLISELLREKYGFDGVVCTDWGITHDQSRGAGFRGGACWGVENLTEAERHYKVLMNDVDQFGGNNDAGPLLEAYTMGCREHGEDFMRRRIEKSAVRLLANMFCCGLFENPYVDSEESAALVGCDDYCRAGYKAQLKSVVLLKNQDRQGKTVLPLKERAKVYVPKRFIREYRDFFGHIQGNEWVDPVDRSVLEQYFDVADTPEDADAALVVIMAPESEGYNDEDREKGGNGYMPISLQYRPYTAKNARVHSIAGGDPLEDFTDRGYQGKTNMTLNEQDLDNVLEMRKKMGDKPVIVIDVLNKPSVMAEFEPAADAIVAEFGIQIQAVLDVITGKFQPSGLLPIQIPKDMETVEAQLEDVPFDMIPYKDSVGHIYDFGYGMNFNGVIDDERTKKYTRP